MHRSRSYPRRALPALALLLPVLLLPALLLLPGAPRGAPKAEPWPRWEQEDANNPLHIDHGAWTEFLQRNLITGHPSGINRLDYANVSQVDRAILDGYVALLAGLPISTYRRKEQKPYWINLYNALTVQVVLKHWPVGSIRDIDISPGLLSSLFGGGPWDAKLVTVEGIALTLNDIEHRILRPVWRDNRVHYAVNCASLGCPNLAPTAYTVFNIERLLDEGARAYVNHPRGARFESGELIVSSIYAWFQEDFGGSQAGVLEHLRTYATGELAQRLKTWHDGFDDAYDWSVNAP